MGKRFEYKNVEEAFNWAYEHSHPLDVDVMDVIDAYKFCVEKGDGMAANNIGSLYFNGMGVSKDLNMAASYYELACEMEEPMAFLNLGDIYYYGGDGVEVDFIQAREIFAEGAMIYHDGTCFLRLGDIYRFGKGIKADIKKAINLYFNGLAQSEDKEDPYNDKNCGVIHLRLGECLLRAEGTSYDPLGAVRQFNMALNYLYGVLDDDEFVIRYIRKAKKLRTEAEEVLEEDMIAEYN